MSSCHSNARTDSSSPSMNCRSTFSICCKLEWAFKKGNLKFLFFPWPDISILHGPWSGSTSFSWMRKICPGYRGFGNIMRIQTHQPITSIEMHGAEEESREAQGREGGVPFLGAHHTVGTPALLKSSQSPSSEFNPGIRMKVLRNHCPLTSFSPFPHWSSASGKLQVLSSIFAWSIKISS